METSSLGMRKTGQDTKRQDGVLELEDSSSKTLGMRSRAGKAQEWSGHGVVARKNQVDLF